tara:strand:+ start:166 stop:591 length:426 start_codon:yes stop_codon:yes gene_type:complete
MSELRADTITASNGTGPVTLTKQQTAKCMAGVNMAGTAELTANVSGAINASSLTDNGTGDGTTAFTNNMSAALYYVNADDTGRLSDVFTRSAFIYHDYSTGVSNSKTGMTTGSIRQIAYYEGSSRAHYDYAYYFTVNGDLA